MNLEKQNVKIHASLPNKILIEPLVSICQVGCCKVLAWKLFQWFLYMSRVSQKNLSSIGPCPAYSSLIQDFGQFTF